MKLRDKPLTDHEEIVVRLYDEAKLTFLEIGRQMEVTPNRGQQIYTAAKIKLQDFAVNGEDALSLLPLRVRRVVGYCGMQMLRAAGAVVTVAGNGRRRAEIIPRAPARLPARRRARQGN